MFSSLLLSFLPSIVRRCGVAALLSSALLLPGALTAAPLIGGDPHKLRAATEAAAAVATVTQHKELGLKMPLVVDAAALAAAEVLRVDRYAATQQFAQELACHLDLQDRASVGRLATAIGHLLGTDTPAGFVPATADIVSLQDLVTTQTWALQRQLTEWLPETAFGRYQALLDQWDVK